MKAKDKAKELVGMFDLLVNTWDCWNDVMLTNKQTLRDRKQCALICVDEIMKEQEFGTNHYYGRVDFWEQVKQEIEKL